MAKKYCKKVTQKKGVTINNFHVPMGGIYGRTNEQYFVCIHPAENPYRIYVDENGNGDWIPKKITQKDSRFAEIIKANKTEIPKKQERITGTPKMRHVNYNYMPTSNGTHSLVRQCFDNADQGGGGIYNELSYWSIYKDMDRRYVR